MKVALCFIISYEHILNKEDIWRSWIRENQDIINVYFYYKDRNLIKSPWMLEHCLPEKCIYQTSYYHVIPAYLSLLNYAIRHDPKNQWFCFLTDSCCPIVSPRRFRHMFFQHSNKTFMSWKKAWWNPSFHKRANLALLPEEFRLANDPWFIMKREHAHQCLHYVQTKPTIVKQISDGGLANESLFAIILYSCKELLTPSVLNALTHAADWSRMMSSTSPYLFSHNVCKQDIDFIEKTLDMNVYTMFLRKVSPDFPDKTLKYYIYEYRKAADSKLLIISHFYYYLCGIVLIGYGILCWLIL